MTLLEEADASIAPRGPQCAVAALRVSRPELVAELDELLASSHYSTTIVAVLKKHDIDITTNIIGRHRPTSRDKCGCLS